MQLPPPESIASVPEAGVGGSDPLNTVGLALLAYGLVQVISRVVDKLPIGHSASEQSARSSEPGDDRTLSRLLEMVAADAERIRRLEEAINRISDQTKWLADQRTRRDAQDGLPVWNCRGPAILDQLETQQKLTGQALDDLRAIDGKLDNLLRKFRALWRKIGRRSKDGD